MSLSISACGILTARLLSRKNEIFPERIQRLTVFSSTFNTLAACRVFKFANGHLLRSRNVPTCANLSGTLSHTLNAATIAIKNNAAILFIFSHLILCSLFIIDVYARRLYTQPHVRSDQFSCNR
jgi:hypothetical protein